MTRSITAVRPKARKRDRVVIYLDGEPALEVASILALGLKSGQVLGEDAIRDLQKRDLHERTLQSALGLLRRRPYTERELRLRFSQRKVPKEVQESVLSTLSERGQLDDQAFAREWVGNRRDFRPRGVRALRFEMLRKGVPREIIEESLTGYDEEGAALDAGLRYARRLRGLSAEEFRERLQAHLSRRGFDRDVLDDVLERVRKEIAEAKGEDPSEVVT
jgi:regulatory protein